MNERRKKTSWPIATSLMAATAVMLFGVYVGGYYATGTKLEASLTSQPGKSCYRIYPTAWQARIFWPAAQVESILTGDEVFAVIEVEGSPDAHTFIFP